MLVIASVIYFTVLHNCFEVCQEAKIKSKVVHPKSPVGAKPSSPAKLKRKAAEALGVAKSLAHKAVCLVAGSKETEESKAMLPPGIEIPDETTHTSFFDWFKNSADAACVAFGTASYAQHERLREAWKAAHPRIKAVKPEPKPKAVYRSSKKNYRRQVANQYSVWRAGAGKDSKKPQVAFMLTIRKYPNNKVTRADAQWLRRLIKEFKHEDAEGAPMRKYGKGRAGRGYAAVPAEYRCRTANTQGKSLLCPDIDEMLWEWFVDMRRSFATTVLPNTS